MYRTTSYHRTAVLQPMTRERQRGGGGSLLRGAMAGGVVVRSLRSGWHKACRTLITPEYFFVCGRKNQPLSVVQEQSFTANVFFGFFALYHTAVFRSIIYWVQHSSTAAVDFFLTRRLRSPIGIMMERCTGDVAKERKHWGGRGGIGLIYRRCILRILKFEVDFS